MPTPTRTSADAVAMWQPGLQRRRRMRELEEGAGPLTAGLHQARGTGEIVDVVSEEPRGVWSTMPVQL